MTGHDPIWSREDLAALVAKHDQEHPDHGDNCGCEHGLLPTMRLYLAPPQRTDTPTARPYTMPSDLRVTKPIGPVRNRPTKPWLQPREGETQEQYDWRKYHSCFHCGTVIVDMKALNAHEDECKGSGSQDE